jgi:branched-chain amino acid transport system ATP-binding protein
LLEVEGIDVYYGHIQALRNVTLRVDEGEMVALIGANGAGKTTTLRTISGLLAPVSGVVKFEGRPLNKMRAEEIVGLGVSHVPEGRGMFPNLTVEENLKMGFYTRRADRKMWKQGVERMTTLFPRLKERWGQAAGTMSGGEQQMLALARALLPNPRLLMIDELSLGLAPVVVQQLFSLLREINDGGTTILLVEQYVNQALRLANRAYVLEKGKVTIEGNARTLLESSDVVTASYMGGHVHTGSGNGGEPKDEVAAAGEKAPPKRRPRARPKAASTAAVMTQEPETSHEPVDESTMEPATHDAGTSPEG